MTKETVSFLRLLRELQKIDTEFPLQYAICLTEISLNEGISLTALSQKSGMALSTVSRITGALSQHRQKGRPYGLVKVTTAPEERRRKELFLTPKGRAVMDNIANILAKEPA